MLKSTVEVQLIVRFLLLLGEKETNVSDIVNWDLVIMQQYVHRQMKFQCKFTDLIQDISREENG